VAERDSVALIDAISGGNRPFCAALILALLSLASTARAQDGAIEAYGVIGGGRTYDDEGSVGNGIAGGGNVGFRFAQKAGVELDVNHFRHEREVAGGALLFRGHGTYVTGNVLYHFSNSRVRPYVLGGLGLLHYTNQSRVLPDQQPDGSSSGFALNFGFGIKGFLAGGFVLRPEVRIYSGRGKTIRGVEPPLSNIRFSIGCGYAW
jgi:opacity protein-like surface antigen